MAYLLRNEEVVAKVVRATYYPALGAGEAICEGFSVSSGVGHADRTPGTIFITQAQLFFRSKDSENVLVALPHGALERVRKVQGKEKTGQEYVVDLICKDLRVVRLGFPGKMQYKQTVTTVTTFAYELEIPQLFAFRWRGQDLFPRFTFDIAVEYERCGLTTGDHRMTAINKNYTLCDSYPQLLAVPASATDELLASVADFRSRGRLPVATYKYAPSGAALYRCSQPLVGLKNTRSSDDEVLLAEMAALPARLSAPSTAPRILHIMDARPKVAAVGNKFLGAGMEHVGPGSRYEACSLEYMNIGNIHTMRESLQKLLEALELPDRKQQRAVDNSHWKEHLGRILEGAVHIVHSLSAGDPVLVHCTDGWDRTAQLTCLTSLMLDPHYRTMEGFAVLVEKEWLAFGHKFAQRHGHGTFSAKFKDTQRAPIFLQFIDTVWQLMQQFPTSFEWNERFLTVVLDAVYGNVFGTFLCNTDQERRKLYQVIDQTVSVWSYVLARRSEFVNPLFDERRGQESQAALKLHPRTSEQQLQVWRGLYCRFRVSQLGDLVGIPFDTPDCSVLNINSNWNRNLSRTQQELERAVERGQGEGSSSVRNRLPDSNKPQHPTDKPALPPRITSPRTAASLTLETIDVQNSKRRSMLLRDAGKHDAHSSGNESDVGDREADVGLYVTHSDGDSESLEMLRDGGRGSGAGGGYDDNDDDYDERLLVHLAPTQHDRNAVSEPSMASAVLPLDSSLPGTPVLRLAPIPDSRRPGGMAPPEGAVSPRQKDVSKRRGVKLNVDDIKAVTFDQSK